MLSRSIREVLAGAGRRLTAAGRALRGAPVGPRRGRDDGHDDEWWDLLPFTTHRIALPGGLATMRGGVDIGNDVRIELVTTAAGGSLAGRSVVDLGCLEGGFTLAFAQRGAHALGIEARRASVARCEVARALLGAETAEFACADIKLELERRDPFDVLLATGILYHVEDPAALLVTMRRACKGVAVIDTHVAREEEPSHGCSPVLERASGAHVYRGRLFPEYPADTSHARKEGMLWAAWSDADAFWPLEDDLASMIRDAGFSTVEKIELTDAQRTRWQVDQCNRVIYVAHV